MTKPTKWRAPSEDSDLSLRWAHMPFCWICRLKLSNMQRLNRLPAKNDPAPPPGNFANIVYLKEQSFLHRIRDACTL